LRLAEPLLLIAVLLQRLFADESSKGIGLREKKVPSSAEKLSKDFLFGCHSHYKIWRIFLELDLKVQ